MVSGFDPYQERKESLFARLVRRRDFSHFSFFERTLRAFTPGDRFILYTLVGVLAISTFVVLAGANSAVSVRVPAHGGSLTEGVVGPARFINPLLAISGPDKDLSTLVYSGLMRATPEGDLVPDLAQSFEVSEDGTTYTFTLRENLTFHDGVPLTSADVLFTIQRAQDPDMKSVRRADWDGVSVSAPNPNTIVFSLPHAYAPFLENAALGILPRHLWENATADEFPFDPLNVRPIGSGPYKIKSLDTNSTGAATRYELVSFPNFTLGEPYIKKITLFFYPNEEALVSAFNSGRVDSIAGISPSEVAHLTRGDALIARSPLPRVFGVFFNQNKNTVLADAAVRAALAASVDTQAIIEDVLRGFASALDGPIPSGVMEGTRPAVPTLLKDVTEENEAESVDHVAEGRAILERNGWKFDAEEGVWKQKDTVLKVTLATVDDPALAETAQRVADAWKALGAVVETHVYPLAELNALVLRPRNYEAILFGEVVGRSLDLFAFWHSSQRNDPGLNLALYTNSKADSLLAHARSTIDKDERERLYQEFAEVVADDQPAIFLYAPDFIYIVPQGLGGVEIGALTHPGERYLNVYEWYTDTESVWNVFTNTSE